MIDCYDYYDIIYVLTDIVKLALCTAAYFQLYDLNSNLETMLIFYYTTCRVYGVMMVLAFTMISIWHPDDKKRLE